MRLWPLMLMLPALSCAPATQPESPSRSGEALCDAAMPLVDRHAEALASEGSDTLVLTGQPLISMLDAFCGP